MTKKASKQPAKVKLPDAGGKYVRKTPGSDPVLVKDSRTAPPIPKSKRKAQEAAESGKGGEQ